MDDLREWICPHCGNTNQHWTQWKTFRQGWTAKSWQCKKCKQNANTENEPEEVLEAVTLFPFHKSSDDELGTEDEDDEEYYGDDKASEEEEDEEDANDIDKKQDDVLDGINKKTDVQQCSQGSEVNSINLDFETEKVAPSGCASGPSRRKRRLRAQKEQKVMPKKQKEEK